MLQKGRSETVEPGAQVKAGQDPAVCKMKMAGMVEQFHINNGREGDLYQSIRCFQDKDICFPFHTPGGSPVQDREQAVLKNGLTKIFSCLK